MNLHSVPVPELIRSCTETGDQSAWREFIDRFHRVIAATVVKTCQRWRAATPELIDDLIQETYLKICADGYRVLRDFDARRPDSFFGLLKTVAYSVVQDHFRASTAAKRGAGRDDLLYEDAMTTQVGAPEKIERDILIGEIRVCLHKQSSRDQIIFWLHFRQGMTAREISQIPTLMLSQKGIEAVLVRVTRQLRAEMAGLPGISSAGKPAGITFQLGDG